MIIIYFVLYGLCVHGKAQADKECTIRNRGTKHARTHNCSIMSEIIHSDEIVD